MTKTLMIVVALGMFVSAKPAWGATIPIGVQIDVSKDLVTNGWEWSVCFDTPGGSQGVNLQRVLSACTGDYLMMAAYQGDAPNFAILAAAEFSDATFDTGKQTGNLGGIDDSHTANGVEWYFNDDHSWGFSELGNTVRLHSCDLELAFNRIGMCWHTNSGTLVQGFALNNGSFETLYGDWNRVLLTADFAVPEPGTLALLGLGLAGMGFARSRKR